MESIPYAIYDEVMQTIGTDERRLSESEIDLLLSKFSEQDQRQLIAMVYYGRAHKDQPGPRADYPLDLVTTSHLEPQEFKAVLSRFADGFIVSYLNVTVRLASSVLHEPLRDQ